MPGFTAYIGLFEYCHPKAGETVYVNSAAGAVGQVVCQIAKALGTRVVASAGTDDKVQFLLEDLGVDYAFNYKSGSLTSHLQAGCPKGIDVIFEQVGGEQFEVALNHCNTFARIAVCGMISQYNKTPAEMYPIRNLI